MNVKRGDIYWITSNPHRPTTGSVQKPGRPGIIVSNDANNACAYTFEVVYLTGKPKKELPTHCTINSAQRTSIALCEQIQTVSDEQLREYIGHCTDEEMKQIDRGIAISLGLPDPAERKPITGPVAPAIEYSKHQAVVTGLERDLAEAQVREAILQKMYDDLLTRVMAK